MIVVWSGGYFSEMRMFVCDLNRLMVRFIYTSLCLLYRRSLISLSSSQKKKNHTNSTLWEGVGLFFDFLFSKSSSPSLCELLMCQKGNRHRDAFRFGNSLSLAFRFSTCVLCSCLIEVCVICIHTCVRCRVTQLILTLLTKKKAGERDFFLLWFFFFSFSWKERGTTQTIAIRFHVSSRCGTWLPLAIPRYKPNRQSKQHTHADRRERERGGKDTPLLPTWGQPSTPSRVNCGLSTFTFSSFFVFFFYFLLFITCIIITILCITLSCIFEDFLWGFLKLYFKRCHCQQAIYG